MKNAKFKKSERLLTRSEFIRVKRTGKRCQTKYFIAEFTAGRFERTRLGITVTKKTGSAVKRNRLKRIIRESFRQNRQHISGHWDIHIIAKKEAATPTLADACSAMQKIFESLE